MQEARNREMDHYVQVALDSAIESALEREPSADGGGPLVTPLAPEWDQAVYAAALHAASSRLVHELSGLVGLAISRASREIADADASDTVSMLHRIDGLLAAIDKLGSVADTNERDSFQLDTVIRSVAAEADGGEREFTLLGPDGIVVDGNEALVEMIIRNGASNAVEASADPHSGAYSPVTINWGLTDREAWVAVVDHGTGVPSGVDVFGFARSSKADHLGVGLALAQQAAVQLGGTLTLDNRIGGGATLRLAWPQDEP